MEITSLSGKPRRVSMVQKTDGVMDTITDN